MPITLSEQEKIVLSVVREYLNKNRHFNMDKVLPFINSRFKMASIDINLNGIERTLKSLIEKKILVKGSKLTERDILKNIKRLTIYHYIVKHPGVYFNKVLKDLAIPYHVLMWHLEILLKFAFIKKDMFENHDIYYEWSLKFDNIKIKFFFNKDKSREIIDYLKKNDEGTTKTQLSKDLGMHPNTISKYLDSLESFKILIKNSSSNKIHYFFNEEYAYL